MAVFGRSKQDHNLGFNKLVTAAKHKVKVAAKPSVLFGSVRSASLPSTSSTYKTSVNKAISSAGVSRSRSLGQVVSAARNVQKNANSAKVAKPSSISGINYTKVNSGKIASPEKLTSSNISGTDYEAIAQRNNQINIAMNRENNKFNAAQAEAQRNYETMMANTAHQREVADLKAAGLNPILSAGGQGAVTPVGSNATSSNFAGTDNSIVTALADLAASSISANASMTAAQTHANAQRDAASMSAGAMVASAAEQAAASMYGANQAAAASMYGSDQAARASMYGSFMNAGTGRYSADRQQENAIFRLLK